MTSFIEFIRQPCNKKMAELLATFILFAILIMFAGMSMGEPGLIFPILIVVFIGAGLMYSLATKESFEDFEYNADLFDQYTRDAWVAVFIYLFSLPVQFLVVVGANTMAKNVPGWKIPLVITTAFVVLLAVAYIAWNLFRLIVALWGYLCAMYQAYMAEQWPLEYTSSIVREYRKSQRKTPAKHKPLK